MMSRVVAVGKAVTRLPPARIPACGITALGSSDRLASASSTAISFSEVCIDSPTFPSRSMFPLKVASACQSLSPANGVTVSEYYELIRLPAVIGFPTHVSVRPTCSPVGDAPMYRRRNPQGLPSS
jgi:hypothetical protein